MYGMHLCVFVSARLIDFSCF